MIVNAIYHGLNQIVRVYRNGKIVFEDNPIEFHIIEDGKLIIAGAFEANSSPDGLYLDCAPDVEWENPVQTENVLHITQVYNATQNGSVLEVE